MDNVSMERLNKLHPAIRESAIRAYKKAVQITPEGVHPVVVQTIRTFEEQDLLYQKGRTRPGPKVTNAKAGQGNHNYGFALDFALMVNGKLVWKVDKNWMLVVQCFKEEGFDWGGDWKSFKDYPHVEKPLGHKWQDLLKKYNAGERDEAGYVKLNC